MCQLYIRSLLRNGVRALWFVRSLLCQVAKYYPRNVDSDCIYRHICIVRLSTHCWADFVIYIIIFACKTLAVPRAKIPRFMRLLVHVRLLALCDFLILNTTGNVYRARGVHHQRTFPFHTHTNQY